MSDASAVAARERHRLKLGVILATLVLFAAFGAAEVGCRWLAPVQLSRHSPDAIIGFRMTPLMGRDGVAEVNRQGVPDVEVPTLRSPNEVRVLCLGDSVTAGLTLASYDVRWTRVLQHELAKLAPDRTFRVINAGIEGYQITQMRLLLEDLGPQYRPDIVVVMFQNPAHNVYVPPNPALMWRYRVHDWFLASSLVKVGVLWFTGYESFGNWEGEVRPLPAPDPAEAIAANLGSFTQYATSHGSEVLFARAPAADPALPGAPPALPAEIYAALDALVARSGIAMWSPKVGTQTFALGAATFSEGDPLHLSAEGNAAVGKDLAAEIGRQGWLDKPAVGSQNE